MSSANLEDRLSNLLAVTDSRLTRLDVDDLLVEVLERVRTILEADTAAVLLRQEGSDELIARAACGLEEEVRQGVRVPIGTGFAGTIAARREPVVLDRVDSTTVANPILWEKGIRRMLGVPLMAGPTVLGVLHVGRLRDQSFTQHDAELLQIAAERIAAAIQTRRSAVESAAAALLERGLLPARLPDVPGLQFAARYAPAEDRSIGGDWYDAFVLPSKALWVVIGDVAGHGLNSAVVMSRVRSALRAYAMLGGGPADVLELTNRKVEHFEIGMMVTVLCAVARPPYNRFEISTAGHPPPVLAAPAGVTQLLPLQPGPPLGIVPKTSYPSVEVELPPGGVLLLYTDGLVERRDEPMDVGLERLRSTVVAQDPERVCQQVMLRLVGTAVTFDDVALLAVSRASHDTEGDGPAGTGAARADAGDVLVAEQRFEPYRASVGQARRFAVWAAAELGEDVRSVLELLVSEAATNSVMHGGSAFTVRMYRAPAQLRVEISDDGDGTAVVRRAAPTDLRGRGMYIIAQLADTWGVRPAHPAPGKTVWFTLALGAADLDLAASETLTESMHA